MNQRPKPESSTVPSRVWRRIGIVASGVVGLLLLLAVIAAFLILRTTPPPSIHTDPAAARRLQEKLQEAQAAASRGLKESVQVDETELNSLLEAYLPMTPGNRTVGQPADVHDIKLKLVDDRIQAHLLLNFRGKDISMDCEGKIHNRNGYLEFEPISAKLGSLPIPRSSLESAARRLAAAPESRQQLRLPGNVKDLRIEEGKIVVVYD